MFIIGQILIFFGFIIQIFNLVIDIAFIHYKKGNISQGKFKTILLDFLVLGMVSLFCAVYLIIFFLKLQSIWVGILLFAGAVFVTTVLLWIFSLTRETKKNAFSISETLIGVIEARDPNLNGHSIHVMELSLLIYSYLPLHFRRTINKENLKYAALFHDVGKLGIPESILNKPAKLNDEEWVIMKRHPEISVKILKPLKFFDLLKEWILYHHERIDGNGYFKIPEKNIPFAARIISVADTYSAIRMSRSYKNEKTYEEAVSIIKEVSGKQLDSTLVDIFCSIPKAEVEGCMQRVKERLQKNQENVGF